MEQNLLTKPPIYHHCLFSGDKPVQNFSLTELYKYLYTICFAPAKYPLREGISKREYQNLINEFNNSIPQPSPLYLEQLTTLVNQWGLEEVLVAIDLLGPASLPTLTELYEILPQASIKIERFIALSKK